MPIVSTDIKYRYSAPTALAGNTTVFAGPGTSRGRWVSSTTLPDGGLNNLFPDITGDENAALNNDYQCVFVYNSHATLSLRAAKVWIASQIAGGANAAIALDDLPASSLSAGSFQATMIGSKDGEPTGISPWSTATTKATGIALGDIPAGFVRAVWIRRTATNSGATANDGVTIRVEGDTSA